MEDADDTIPCRGRRLKAGFAVRNLLARQPTDKEMLTSLNLQDAIDKAWYKLIAREAWGLNIDDSDVRNYATKNKKRAHDDHALGSGLSSTQNLTKSSGSKRDVSCSKKQGHRPDRFQSSFCEQDSPAFLMAADDVLDAVGHKPCTSCENTDATGAYTQSLMTCTRHVETWIAFSSEIVETTMPRSWRKTNRSVGYSWTVPLSFLSRRARPDAIWLVRSLARLVTKSTLREIQVYCDLRGK